MTAKRDSIIAAAARLFSERGYDASPVSEIARQAGVSEGAIFRHFKTKEDLLCEILGTIRATFAAYVEERFRFEPAERGLDTVMRLTRLFCRFYEEHELEFDCIQRNDPYHRNGIGPRCRDEIAAIHDRMCELLAMGITLGIKDGSIRPGAVNPRAVLILGTILGAVRLRVFRPDQHLTALEETFLDMLAGGLARDAAPQD